MMVYPITQTQTRNHRQIGDHYDANIVKSMKTFAKLLPVS